MNKLVKVGIVIVNYNGEKYQNDCIKSIFNSKYDNYNIIIVDNASTDKSMELLNEFDDDRIVKVFNASNEGVACGNNIGIKKSIELNCDATLLLNNDTILEDDTISRLVDSLEKFPVVTPKIYFFDTNKIWYGGGSFVRRKCVNIHYHYKKDDKGIDYLDSYDYAPTCCMLISNSVFNDIGYMDEKYFLYFDDTDFCFRLKMNDIKIGFVKEATMYHKVSLSTGGAMSKIGLYYENRNRLYFWSKYKNFFKLDSFLYLILSRYLKGFVGIIKKDNRKYILKAIKDYKKGKMGRCIDL